MAYSVGGKTGQDQLLLNLKIRFDCHIESNPLVSFSMALTPYATVFEGDEISSWSEIETTAFSSIHILNI